MKEIRPLGNPTRHHLFVSHPCLDLQGALGSRGPTLGVSLFPRGSLGPLGNPKRHRLFVSPPLSRSSEAPRAQVPYTGCFFVPQGPLGLRGTLLVITCSYHTHLSRSLGALPRGPKMGVSLDRNSHLSRSPGERGGPCHRQNEPQCPRHPAPQPPATIRTCPSLMLLPDARFC